MLDREIDISPDDRGASEIVANPSPGQVQFQSISCKAQVGLSRQERPPRKAEEVIGKPSLAVTKAAADFSQNQN